ncbi:MAG: hypothetical protein FJX77_08405, partial [Armatimonadetes bacterium]|nr:hypothetical protein [Armatimonadota bacterium]
MKRPWLWAGFLAGLLLAPAGAQDRPTSAPAGAPTGAPVSPDAAPKPAAPPGPAEKSGAAPSAAAAPAGGKVTVRVPTGGEYSAYIQEAADGALQNVAGQVELTLPAEGAKATLVVLDRKAGYAALRPLDPTRP